MRELLVMAKFDSGAFLQIFNASSFLASLPFDDFADA